MGTELRDADEVKARLESYFAGVREAGFVGADAHEAPTMRRIHVPLSSVKKVMEGSMTSLGRTQVRARAVFTTRFASPYTC